MVLPLRQQRAVMEDQAELTGSEARTQLAPQRMAAFTAAAGVARIAPVQDARAARARFELLLVLTNTHQTHLLHQSLSLQPLAAEHGLSQPV